MPSNAPIGLASLQVTVNNVQSNPMRVTIVNNAFGIFTVSGAGLGPGILQNFVSATQQPVNSPTLSAAPGQTVVLWGTGLGPVTYGDNVAPTATNLPTPMQLFVGNVAATSIVYQGRTPCCSGVDEIIFQVPANAPLGCWVPVYVVTGGSNVSNVVTMAIQKGNVSTCSDAANPFSSALVAGGKAGAFAAVHATTREDVGTIAPTNIATDFQASTFYSQTATPFPFNSGISLPPAGSCTVYARSGDMLNGDVPPLLTPNGTALDAGPPITLTGPNGSAASNLGALAGLPQALLGYFGGTIGGVAVNGSLALKPGAYQVKSSGGSQVGPFTATMNVPAPITWTGRDNLTTVPRSQPLTISWTGGGASDLVGVAGFGEDLPGNASTAFLCVAQPGANSITIPPAILANLPATRPNPLQSRDVIYLVSLPGSAITSIQPSGLDAGAAFFAYVDGKTVIYR
jgi:uncharacterized protein (TIGR03437 family)